MSLNKLFFVVWCIVLTIITAFLVREYYYFKHQAHELSQLKDDYSTYVLALKKLISEHDASEQPHVQAVGQKPNDQKKKPSESLTQENSFFIVNREPEYLKQSALSYARKQKMFESIKELYDAYQEFEFSQPLPRAKNKKRTLPAKRKTQPSRPLSEQLKKLQREPVFALPIDKPNFWISSLFGPRKKPNGSWGFHSGIDLAAIKGTPVKAAGAGVVIQAAFVSGYGNTIVIAHNRKFKTRYAHLSAIKVHIGQHVEQGELIGKVGATGNVRKSKKGDGSHLHFEVYVFGKQQNPFYYLAH